MLRSLRMNRLAAIVLVPHDPVPELYHLVGAWMKRVQPEADAVPHQQDAPAATPVASRTPTGARGRARATPRAP